MCALYNPTQKWIRIALANINFELRKNRLASIESTKDKILESLRIASEQSADIIVFPEYASDESFDEIFSQFAQANRCNVISGTCIRNISGSNHNTCSVFGIDGKCFQIMKKNLTPYERSSGHVVPYTEVIHDDIIRLDTRFGEIEVLVKICLDFIIEDRFSCNRPDLVLIPLYNDKDEEFEISASRYSFHHTTFVVGVNIGGIDDHSTIGGWNSNKQIAKAFSDAELLQCPHRPTTCMKYHNEKLVILELDLATPYVTSHGQALHGSCNARIVADIAIETNATITP